MLNQLDISDGGFFEEVWEALAIPGENISYEDMKTFCKAAALCQNDIDHRVPKNFAKHCPVAKFIPGSACAERAAKVEAKLSEDTLTIPTQDSMSNEPPVPEQMLVGSPVDMTKKPPKTQASLELNAVNSPAKVVPVSVQQPQFAGISDEKFNKLIKDLTSLKKTNDSTTKTRNETQSQIIAYLQESSAVSKRCIKTLEEATAKVQKLVDDINRTKPTSITEKVASECLKVIQDTVQIVAEVSNKISKQKAANLAARNSQTPTNTATQPIVKQKTPFNDSDDSDNDVKLPANKTVSQTNKPTATTNPFDISTNFTSSQPRQQQTPTSKTPVGGQTNQSRTKNIFGDGDDDDDSGNTYSKHRLMISQAGSRAV